jgi:hypothetical protein
LKSQRGRHGIKSATASALASAKVACGWPKDSCGAGTGFTIALPPKALLPDIAPA